MEEEQDPVSSEGEEDPVVPVVPEEASLVVGYICCVVPFVIVFIYCILASPKVDLSRLDPRITKVPSTEVSYLSLMEFKAGKIYYAGAEIGPVINILQTPETIEHNTPRGLLFKCADKSGKSISKSKC